MSLLSEWRRIQGCEKAELNKEERNKMLKNGTDKNDRNGTIDFLRAVFCIIILLFHISLDLYGKEWGAEEWKGLFRYGALGVEFFFITSGFFMAASVDQMPERREDTIAQTWEFLQKKIKGILPYHLIFNLVMWGITVLRGYSLQECIQRISSFFFLPVVGFNNGEWMLGVEWYIGYMLFVMLLIFPLLYRYFSIVTEYLAPVGAVCLYGYISVTYHRVMNSSFRMTESFAGILLGITVYTCAKYLKRVQGIRTKPIRVLIRIWPLISIVLFVLYTNSFVSTEVQPLLVLFLASGLAVTFAQEGIISRTGILNCPLVYWLGRVSISVYLIQNITRLTVKKLLDGRPVLFVFTAEFIVTVLCGIIAYGIIQKITQARRKSHD